MMVYWICTNIDNRQKMEYSKKYSSVYSMKVIELVKYTYYILDIRSHIDRLYNKLINRLLIDISTKIELVVGCENVQIMILLS